MIQQSDDKRIQARDYIGDRWSAEITPPVEQLGMPKLVKFRIGAESIHLKPSDALSLAAWLRKVAGPAPSDSITVHFDEPQIRQVPVRVPCQRCGWR